MAFRNLRLFASALLGTVGSVVSVAAPAEAFISSPVGGHPGEVDFGARVTLERGKVEPNENAASFQKARWNVFTVGGGYTVGDVGPLRDVRLGLDGAFFTSPAEVNDASLGAVPPSACLGRVTSPGECEFYGKKNGFLVTPRLSANLVHNATFAFGVYLQGTVPLGYSLEKYVLPRADYIGGGLTLGVHITPWLGFENNTYVGSGAFGRQNAVVAQGNVFVFEAQRWVLPWAAGVKVGPYWEGDVTKRFDDRYDAAYTDGYPSRRDRVQSMKFGVAFLPYFRVTEHVAIELGYVQKLFGYDATHTQTYYFGMRGAL